VSKVAAACLYHLRRLGQIRRRVDTEITVQLVLALITSRLDYCNSFSRTLQLGWLSISGRATMPATVLSNYSGCRSAGAYNTNLIYADAWNHYRQVSWLPANHRPTSHFITSRASFGGVPCAEVRHTTTTHEVWRAWLQLSRPSRVDLTSCRHPLYNWDTDV